MHVINCVNICNGKKYCFQFINGLQNINSAYNQQHYTVHKIQGISKSSLTY